MATQLITFLCTYYPVICFKVRIVIGPSVMSIKLIFTIGFKDYTFIHAIILFTWINIYEIEY